MRVQASPSTRVGGFTLTEVLVAAGILAVLMAALVPNLRRSWENERVLAVSNEFASWLNQVKTYSMRNNLTCQVTITPAGNESGASLANVNDLVVDASNNCIPAGSGLDDDFLIPEMPAGRFDIDVNGAATPVAFKHTPRGATTNIDPVTVRFRSRGETNWLRCVQISPILGQVRVGTIVGVGNAGACMID
jgi:prepilin-type N-terminal cleavage/methylation domain-containing protein